MSTPTSALSSEADGDEHDCNAWTGSNLRQQTGKFGDK